MMTTDKERAAWLRSIANELRALPGAGPDMATAKLEAEADRLDPPAPTGEREAVAWEFSNSGDATPPSLSDVEWEAAAVAWMRTQLRECGGPISSTSSDASRILDHIDRLTRERDGWEEEARRSHQNVAFAQQQRDEARALVTGANEAELEAIGDAEDLRARLARFEALAREARALVDAPSMQKPAWEGWCLGVVGGLAALARPEAQGT